VVGDLRRRILPVVVLALVVLVAATGCGRLSKKDYIKQGDEICRRTNVEADKVPVPNKTDVRGTAEYLRTTSRLLVAQVDQLDRLKAPAKDEPRLHDVYRRFRDALTQQQNAANQYQLFDQDNAQITANNANAALAEIRQDLQGYGFQVCAQS
jgi:hypothetical protein